jgi:hypothetical protein
MKCCNAQGSGFYFFGWLREAIKVRQHNCGSVTID